ncbi:MAG: ankyrin repeat domain-containing protein [Rudaea sp.]|uniref:ankyrin repeat domain-containing protein n=1 Tax=unclassified Rudaea TaxID=2627037 RepID=UPI0010F9DAD4|nr:MULTISPECIES: ankyrin repeat domain-containing protein [unclassified Rudaea]MBN8886842.1 ankyrin repeat domain-containing protein [Rudaea sp.]
MSKPRPGRPQNFFFDLACFLPALAVFSLAAFVRHPAIALALIVGNALTMAAVTHALHRGRKTSFASKLAPGAVAYFVLLAAYAAVFALVAFFPSRLILGSASLAAALLLSAAVFVLLLAPWRAWPAFGLAPLFDDLFPARKPGGMPATIERSVDLAHRLTGREDLFFPQGLVVSLSLFVLTFGAFAIAEIGIELDETTRLIALAVYALVCAPLAHWLIVRASFGALLAQRDLMRRTRGRRDAVQKREPTWAEPEAVSAPAEASAPPPAPIDQAELDAALLRHARGCQGKAALGALAQGADPNFVPAPGDRDQRSVIVLACVAQDLALLRALIAKGADINRMHAGLAPLIAATRDSYQGRPDVVITLLTNGADPHCVDADGNTPLHFAVRAAEPTVAALLCDASAPIDAVNREGYTPLAIACALGRGDLARFLLERRADVEIEAALPALIAAAAAPDDNTDTVKLLLKRGARVDATDGHGRAALAVAAQHDNAHIATVLLKAGAAIGATDALGVTALMEAAIAGADEALDVLGANAPVLEQADHTGRTALMFAAESINADDAFVDRLLALGASRDTATADGRRAVDFAAAAGRWSIVALLDPGYVLPANVDTSSAPAASAREDSPAHLLDALRFGHWQIADSFAEAQRGWPMAQRAQLFFDLAAHGDPAARAWLIDHGLDPNACLPGGLSLAGALLVQLPTSLAALRELVDAGAQVTGVGMLDPLFDAIARYPERREELEALALTMIERGADIFAADANRQTPLARAVAGGSASVAQALLARGVDPNLRDRHGRSPLFAAFALPASLADATTRALIRAGADPELAAANGETPLGLALGSPQSSLRAWFDWAEWKLPKRALRAADLPAAAQLGDAAAVAKLIDLGFPVDAHDAKGASALMRAAGAGRADIVKLLLERGADVAQTTVSGATPLSAAVSARRQNVVEALLERGVTVDQRMPGGGTVLMIAAALGYPDIVAALLARGADANAQDEHGTRPLHAAAQFAFAHRDTARARQTLELLVGKGAELDACDDRGDSALHILLGARAEPRSVGDQQHLQSLLSLFLVGRADVNLQDDRGVSPLHACAMHGLILPARALLAARADPEAADSMGRTPREVADLLGFIDVAAELTVRLPGAMPLPGQPAAQR